MQKICLGKSVTIGCMREISPGCLALFYPPEALAQAGCG
jgi:hypothetical protein